MIQPTYNIVSGQNLLSNYRVHYNFEQFVGAASNEHLQNGATTLHSGFISAVDSPVDPTDALDYFTGNLGSGTFSGGLGQFYHHVDIQEPATLFSSEFTMLVAAQTTSLQDLGSGTKGPVSNNNILFSNLDGSGNCWNGWQVGINASNRAYVECYDKLQPVQVTYMGDQTPFSHNIWSVMYRGGSLKVGLYDIKESGFNFTSQQVAQSSITPELVPWKIGSGVNYDPSVIFASEMALNSGLFAGKISDFVYFNTGLSDSEVGTVAKSLYAPFYTTSLGSSESIFAGATGALSSVETETGILGFGTTAAANTLTGNDSKTYFVQLTGFTTSGNTYYLYEGTVPHELNGTQDVYRALYNTGYPTTGILGFFQGSQSVNMVQGYTGYSNTTLTGFTLSGSNYGVGTGALSTLSFSDNVSGVSGAAPVGFRPDAFSYMLEDQSYFVEKINLDDFEINNRWSLNNTASNGYSTLQQGKGMYLDRARTTGTIGFYLNGDARWGGTLQLNSTLTTETVVITNTNETYAITCSGIINLSGSTTEEYNSYFKNYNILSGDYSISGIEIIDSLQFTGVNESPFLGIYDHSQPTGGWGKWLVTNTGDYLTPPSPHTVDGSQMVFLNGQKLASGLNYTGTFGPSGYVTGVTGLYFTFPLASGAITSTGTVASYYDSYFWPNSNMVFFNGIRQDVKTSYLEHSSSKDLISGQKTHENLSTTVYNTV